MLLLPGCEEPPTAQWAEKTWRLDAGPNRTSYSRQMEALVRLCSEGDGLMSQLLREASVTRLADWAAREREGMSLPGMEAEAEVMDEDVAAADAKVEAGGAARVEGAAEEVVASAEAEEAGAVEAAGLAGTKVGAVNAGQPDDSFAPHLEVDSAAVVPVAEVAVDGAMGRAGADAVPAASEVDATSSPSEAAAAPAPTQAATIQLAAHTSAGEAVVSRESELTVMASQSSEGAEAIDSPHTLQGAEAVDLLHTLQGAEAAESFCARVAAGPVLERTSMQAIVEARERIATVSNLSDSQRVAISAALERRLTIIQGPPGTGKTTTSIQILRGWTSTGVGPSLAVAECNVAVDNIAAGLVALGLNVVRVGRPEKVCSPCCHIWYLHSSSTPCCHNRYLHSLR